MATNKQLETQVNTLTERVTRLQTSNSELRDELVILKGNYSKLVNDLSQRLEVIHNRFRSNG
jgi:predicted nuclease with TOPRIM domain